MKTVVRNKFIIFAVLLVLALVCVFIALSSQCNVAYAEAAFGIVYKIKGGFYTGSLGSSGFFGLSKIDGQIGYVNLSVTYNIVQLYNLTTKSKNLLNNLSSYTDMYFANTNYYDGTEDKLINLPDGYYSLKYGSSTNALTEYNFYFDGDSPVITVNKKISENDYEAVQFDYVSKDTYEVLWTQSKGSVFYVSASDNLLTSFTFTNGDGKEFDYTATAGNDNSVTLTEGKNVLEAVDEVGHTTTHIIYYDNRSPVINLNNYYKSSKGIYYFGIEQENFSVKFSDTTLNYIALDGKTLNLNKTEISYKLSELGEGKHTFTATDRYNRTTQKTIFIDLTNPYIEVKNKSGQTLLDAANSNEMLYFNISDDTGGGGDVTTKIYRYENNRWQILDYWTNYIRKTVYYDGRQGYPTYNLYNTKKEIETALLELESSKISSFANWNDSVTGTIISSEQSYALEGSNYYQYTDGKTTYIFFDVARLTSFLQTEIIPKYISSTTNYFFEEGTFKIEVVDFCGNKTEKTFSIDLTKPTLNIFDCVTESGNVYYTNHTFSVAADDLNFVSINYRIDGGEWQVLLSKEFIVTISGKYEIYSLDGFGNASDVYTVHFIVRDSLGNVTSIKNEYKQPTYYIVTLPSRVFGAVQGFSFADYDSALAFAFQREFNQRVTKLSDGTYSYVTVANESVYSVYQTLSSVNAAVEYYAKKYVSEQKTFSDKSNQNVYYTIMSSSGVADEGALTSNLLTKPSLLNSYSENVYLANSTYQLKQYFDIPSKLELYFVAFDNVLSERKSIPIVYGQTFLEALTASDNIVQGYYLFIESDSCGNVESALLYFDLTAPTLSVAITDGKGQSTATIDSSYIQAASSIYALSFDISAIYDFDEFSFLKIVGGNINSVYVSENDIPILNLNTGAGEYVLTLYDRSYNTLEFKVIIAGDKPSLYHSSLSNQTRVSISILLNDRYNALMSLGLFKIDAMGEYTELLYDSDGKAISVSDLDYVLREGGKYTFIMTDLYGRTVEFEPFFYEKGLPTGTLSCQNKSVTNKLVTFLYNSSNYILDVYTLSDSGAKTYFSNFQSTDTDGYTTISISAIAENNKSFMLYMYNASDPSLFNEYYFSIDTIAPAFSIFTTSGERVEANSATNQGFNIVCNEVGATVRYSINGISKAYNAGDEINTQGLYTFTVKDIVGNSESFTVYLDNVCSISVEGDYTLDGGIYKTNSALTIVAKEDLKEFYVVSSSGIVVEPGKPFSANGTYTIYAQDLYLNTKTISIVINNILPKIQLTNVLIGGTTSNSVTVYFDKGQATLSKDKADSVFILSGDSVSEHGKYSVIVTDEFGNVATASFNIDKIVDYTANCESGIVTTETVKLSFNEQLLSCVLIKDDVLQNDVPTTFTQTGFYKIEACDMYSNTLSFEFTIIASKTKEPEFIAPENFEISYVIQNGNMLSLDSKTVFNYGSDGIYTIALTSLPTSNTYSFDIQYDSTVPSLDIVFSDDGKQVSFSNLSKKVNGILKLNGEQISWTENKVLSDVGQYELTLTDDVGNVVVYRFEIKKQLNVWAIISIIVAVSLVAAVVVIVIKTKRRKAV